MDYEKLMNKYIVVEVLSGDPEGDTVVGKMVSENTDTIIVDSVEYDVNYDSDNDYDEKSLDKIPKTSVIVNKSNIVWVREYFFGDDEYESDESDEEEEEEGEDEEVEESSENKSTKEVDNASGIKKPMHILFIILLIIAVIVVYYYIFKGGF